MSRSVLVVGGAGYIGSHCCKALWQAGYLPVTFDNLSTGHNWAVKWGPLVIADMCDQAAIADTLDQWQPVAVMHLAAASLVDESIADPEKYYSNNLIGTLGLLRSMKDRDCRALIFSSTAAVYGMADAGLIPETAKTTPINPYGRTKLMIEQMLADFSQAYRMRAFSFRYFNAAGADPSGEIGEDHAPETHLIPRAIMAAIGVSRELSVYGDDYNTPDGSAVRDYINVVDIATAHTRAVNLLTENHSGGCFNLGTGCGVSVKAIISAVTRVTGRHVPAVVKDRRAGDAASLVADPGRAAREIGFRTTCSDIETIIASALNWHSSNASEASRPAS